MSLQARLLNYTPLYNPNRDVAHNFNFVARTVAASLEDGTWPELAELLKSHNITMEQLGEACAAYCRYLSMAVTEPLLPVHRALEHSGFLACPPMAQVALMATIGQVFTGIQHVGVREATISGDGPVMNMGELVAEGQRVLKFLRRPKWQRSLLMVVRYLVRLWK
jgi:hypothetical protein